MDSYHYLQLLSGNGSGNIIPGAVWNDRSVDGNERVDTIDLTYVSTCDISLVTLEGHALMHNNIHPTIYAVAARCWRGI